MKWKARNEKGSFSCQKRATAGSSFFGLEKHLFE
jgi:hypothetical protein